MQVIHGEISENPLETLAAVSQDVFMPVLTTPANQQGWPDVVAKEVTENLHKFVANGERWGCSASPLHALYAVPLAWLLEQIWPPPLSRHAYRASYPF